jgi:hypothetical protein
MTNLKISALILATATAFAVPASASSLSDSLGVEAGKYTANELVQLKAALDADDYIRADFIMDRANDATLAAEADMLNVSSFAIEHAEENGNYAKADFIRDRNAGNIDEISAAAMARQDAIQMRQKANEEGDGV